MRDEAVHGMGRLGRPGFCGRGRKCASFGAIRDRAPRYGVSDVGGPYAAMPPEAPPPGYGPSYGPRLLPPSEVYTIVRESGFSPLGIPQQRGLVYTISVIDRGGDDGRLVIDARSGRIIRFMPAYRMGDNFNGDLERRLWPGRTAAASDQQQLPACATPTAPDTACRQPLRNAAAESAAARRQARSSTGAAIGCNGETGRAAGIAAITHGRRGKTFGADHADAGNARGAGVLIGRQARAWTR